MSKSKKRGGAQAHRKRVQNRNLKVKAEQTAMQKLMNEAMRKQIEDLRKKYQEESGTTQNPE